MLGFSFHAASNTCMLVSSSSFTVSIVVIFASTSLRLGAAKPSCTLRLLSCFCRARFYLISFYLRRSSSSCFYFAYSSFFYLIYSICFRALKSGLSFGGFLLGNRCESGWASSAFSSAPLDYFATTFLGLPPGMIFSGLTESPSKRWFSVPLESGMVRFLSTEVTDPGSLGFQYWLDTPSSPS